jgi:hypothetical protein
MPKTSLPEEMGDGNAIVPDLDENSIGTIISNEPAANDGGAPTHGGIAERKREERGNTPPEEEPGFGQSA